MSAQIRVYGQGCIDPRYRSAFERFIRSKFGLKSTEFDLKTDAGGVKEIALQTPNGEWMMTNAGIAYHKHGVRIFVLCNHIDCAHYGGSSHFSCLNEESLVYGDHLKKAASMMKERFSDIEVMAYIVSKGHRSSREAFIFDGVSV
jgi:hypothetical protein